MKTRVEFPVDDVENHFGGAVRARAITWLARFGREESRMRATEWVTLVGAARAIGSPGTARSYKEYSARTVPLVKRVFTIVTLLVSGLRAAKS